VYQRNRKKKTYTSFRVTSRTFPDEDAVSEVWAFALLLLLFFF
jgi:nanoRNase/pAp phosphatase (c-di-AMP/oligoRNAs hydrolase)